MAIKTERELLSGAWNVIDTLRKENERLREALTKIKSQLPANPRLPLVWEIKNIVEEALDTKQALSQS